MNSWTDRGCFLLVLYTMLYVALGGKVPEWSALYSGAFALVAVGVIIELYQKG